MYCISLRTCCVLRQNSQKSLELRDLHAKSTNINDKSVTVVQELSSRHIRSHYAINNVYQEFAYAKFYNSPFVDKICNNVTLCSRHEQQRCLYITCYKFKNIAPSELKNEHNSAVQWLNAMKQINSKKLKSLKYWHINHFYPLLIGDCVKYKFFLLCMAYYRQCQRLMSFTSIGIIIKVTK